ncbi:MAG TPA: ABC transporter permease [Clostridia bacterium]|nr:ABC transporter permease [Clostridia bacterium]
MSLLSVFDLSWVAATIRLATPIALAAQGETLSERAGVLNIGLEGVMLNGAFAGVVGAYYTGSPWLGLLCGMLAGALTSLILAVASITFRANQIVIGAAINILAMGLTGVLFRAMFGLDQQVTVNSFKAYPIPFLSDLPVLGPILFQQNPLVYLGYILVPVLTVVLFRTHWGLAVRAVGEEPQAADTAGISVTGTRYLTVLLGGAIGGLGGVSLSLGHLNLFAEGMVSGRGFMALAAVIFGRWHPVGAVLAALFFGGADALQLRMQSLGWQVPYEFMLMLPYVLTLLTLGIFAGRASQPKALGENYAREAR